MLNFIDVNYKNDNGKTVYLRIFEKDEQGFLDKRYPPVAKEQKDFEKRIYEIDKTVNEKLTVKRAFEKNKNHFEVANVDKQLKELFAEKENLEKKHTDVLKTLLSTDVFTDESQKVYPFTGNKNYFSLGDMNGREAVDGQNTRFIPMSAPNITETAEVLPEGGTATPKDIQNDIVVLKTDDTEVNRFVDIIGVGRAIYEDDKKMFDSVFDYLHWVHFVNAENKRALEMLYSSKNALTFTPENIQEHINANLSGSAKQKAIMIVSKSSFAKIDIDVNGNALITRDADGQFIYKHKYVVKEVPDEILPNTETGESRLVIGDMSVLKFFTVRENYSQKDDFNTFAQLDKGVRKEIIALSSTSDSVFIHGFLA